MFRTVRIKDIAQIKSGKRLPKGDDLVTTPTTHPYIRGRDIKNGRITFNAPVYLSEKTFEKIKRYTVNAGDVCVTIVGNIGDVGEVPVFLDKANLTENAVKLVNLSHKCDRLFLKYSLLRREAQHQMKSYAAGAAQPKLGIYKLNEIEILLPGIAEQKKIVAILSQYDDLVENNTRRIQILDETAQRIYREWFVNFRFPGHAKVKFIDSAMGKVPAGWMVKRLGDVLELAYGKALKSEDRKNGDVPVYGSSGIIGYHNRRLVDGPGIIVGRKGNVGSVFWSDTNFFPIDTVFYVLTELNLSYIYYHLQSMNFINNDAAVPGLNRNQAYSLPCLVPEKGILDSFQGIIMPILNHRRLLSLKNDNLRNTWETLLPRLLSGDVVISEKDIAMREQVDGT
ncbi:restriction endonuclease subunit S [bacterium]|nr:MAG: restriction endonuclease subunit S [bacterium]